MAQKQPKAKPIKLKDLEKKHKEINTLSTYVLDDSTNTVLKYYKVFPNTKIEELMKEAYKNLSYVQENDLEFFKNDTQFIQYIYFLIIKHMTHLKDQIPDDFESQIEFMKVIVDLGLFEEIFNHVFDSQEVLRVVDKIKSFVELAAQLQKLEEKTRQELQDKVQHPLMKKKVGLDA